MPAESSFNPSYGNQLSQRQRSSFDTKGRMPSLPSAFIITHLQIGNVELELLKNLATLLGKTSQNSVSVQEVLKECLDRLEAQEQENQKRKKNSAVLSQQLIRMNSISNMEFINFNDLEDEMVNNWIFNPQRVEQKKDFRQMLNLVNNKKVDNKREQSSYLFKGLIQPLTEQQFFNSVLDQQVLYIDRQNNVFKDILTKDDMFKYINNQMLEYTYNIDVVKYFNGEGHTYNTNRPYIMQSKNYREDGQIIEPQVVEKRYNEGCSIRFLHPQRYFESLWYILGSLETLFHCPCFCNVQLTPPNSQGFAPCYDDMDGFILQLEGTKTWQVYRGVDESNILSRTSQTDIDSEQLGQKVFETTLKPGDFLYIPRGGIYVSFTGEEASTNLHVRANQQQTWYDVMQDVLSGALENLEYDHPIVRTTIPKDVWQQAGGMHQNTEGGISYGGQIYARKLLSMFDQLVANQLPIDPVVDYKAANFISKRLPPFSNEITHKQKDSLQLSHQDRVRIYDPTAVRLLHVNNEIVLYHSFNNSRQHHAMDLNQEDDGQNKVPTIKMKFPVKAAVFLEKLCSGGSVRLEAFSHEEQPKNDKTDLIQSKETSESENENIQDYIDSLKNPSLLSLAQILYNQGLLIRE